MTTWFSHVRKTMAMHPKKRLRKILRIATQTYKKRPRHHKTRRRRRKGARTRRRNRRRRQHRRK